MELFKIQDYEFWEKSENQEIEREGEKFFLRRYIRGIASTDAIDKTNEIVLQEGLDYSPLIKEGWFNYEHDIKEIVGIPTNAFITEISGGTRKAFIVEGYLFEGIGKADFVWQLLNLLKNLKKYQRKLGLSVEGIVLEKGVDYTKNNVRIIKKAVVHNVAITTRPANPETSFDVFLKSLINANISKDNILNETQYIDNEKNKIGYEKINNSIDMYSITPQNLEDFIDKWRKLNNYIEDIYNSLKVGYPYHAETTGGGALVEPQQPELKIITFLNELLRIPKNKREEYLKEKYEKTNLLSDLILYLLSKGLDYKSIILFILKYLNDKKVI